MIDLHLHVLPGVDDGAATLDEAVELCRLAAADGCEALVATPHRRCDRWPDLDAAELERRRAELAEAVGERPRLLLGGENRVDSELEDELERPGLGAAVPLAGSRYLLLELEPHGLGPEPVSLVARLAARGWRPIVAHPELTPVLARSMATIARLAAAGALFQVTAMSVTGDFGAAVRERALGMIDSGLVQFVASDAHRPHWRPTGLQRARRVIAERWGASLAEQLVAGNPLAVLEDRPVGTAAAEHAR